MPSSYLAAESVDPITAILLHDYAALGGWSLFFALGIYMITGSIREWWVPGARYRRLEESSVKMLDANIELSKQNGQLIQANEITKHFFEETVPKRGELKQ